MLPLHAGVHSGGTLVAGLPKRSCSAVGVKQDLEGAPLEGQLGERGAKGVCLTGEKQWSETVTPCCCWSSGDSEIESVVRLPVAF